MALYPCPECQREISTDATACPHCGKRAGLAAAKARFLALPKFAQLLLLGLAAVAALLLVLVALVPDVPAPKAPSAPVAPVAPAAPTAPKAPALAPADKHMTVQPGQWFGFKDRELLEKAQRIAAQGDKAAWAQLMSQGAAAGGIVPLKAGAEVFLEDTAVLAGLVKIRRAGEAAGWWTNAEAVK